ncbi:MAG: inositol monophosphatase [Bacteroides sp.]|nr:inositol monophosphatase [Bacteroides sp.]MCM1413654.1 inositol monophosphatase [Bacteroides sp.]MCM1471833.1 inositol monophosphatase [Bacteroides sp.]
MAGLNLEEVAALVESWAREAGDIQLSYFRKPGLEIGCKFNEADVVTAADRASEALIIERIAQTFPEHTIMSEESGENNVESRWRWVIDPLDGTTNFSTGLPGFAVSIALEFDGEPMVAVVYAPYLCEMFTSVKGCGAKLNGRPIACKTNSRLDRSVLSTGFPVDKNISPDNNIDNVAAVLPHIRGLRRLGSAAIDICYVAAGFLDGYWELNLHHWDVAAARLIAEEAGARYELFRHDRGISPVVASPGIFDALKSLLNEAPRKEM